jgi:hypothetical protein
MACIAAARARRCSMKRALLASQRRNRGSGLSRQMLPCRSDK